MSKPFQIVLGNGNYVMMPELVYHDKTEEKAIALRIDTYANDDARAKFSNDREHFDFSKDLVYCGSIIMKDPDSARILMSLCNMSLIMLEKLEKEKTNG